MKSPEVRTSSKHHSGSSKKKSRRSSSSSSGSDSSSSPEVKQSKKRRHEEEPKRRHEEPSRSKRDNSDDRHLMDRNRDRSRDRPRHDHRDNKKGGSPSRDRDRRRDRSRSREDSGRRRENRGNERWEDEERRYAPRVKREQGSDDEDRPRRGGNDFRGRGRGGFRGRGGRQSKFQSNAKEESFDWGKKEHREEKPKAQVDKEQPNFGLSGKLTEATNTVNGVVVKYSEPPESRKPTRRWRLYVFKGDETLPTLYIHRQSAYLIGKDRRVADIRLDHPSVSAQHAALQYRLVSTKTDDGVKSIKAIRPYIIDLESSNGTFLNNNKIEPRKYVELREKDMLKFGFSSREYVVLHEHSQDGDSGEEITEEGPN